MAIPNKTALEIFNNSINTVDKISHFYKEITGKITYNLRWAPSGAPFIFGAISQNRIIVACEIVWYYKKFGCALTAADLQWNAATNYFDIQWKYLMDKKSKDDL